MKTVSGAAFHPMHVTSMVKTLVISSLVAVVLAAPLGAQTVAYTFAWVGNNGYSMLGNFSFDAASAGDGAVRDAEVLSLTFEGFLNNVSIGSNSTAHIQGDFNFNFDAAAGQFLLDGFSTGDAGQLWNFNGAGLGFASGDLSSRLTLDANGLGAVLNPVPLVATQVPVSVPEPGTFTLLAFAIGALGVAYRRRPQF